ncbi:hypothetical protein BH24ACI2_BH24ACI2_14460 [soil metagenome]
MKNRRLKTTVGVWLTCLCLCLNAVSAWAQNKTDKSNDDKKTAEKLTATTAMENLT